MILRFQGKFARLPNIAKVRHYVKCGYLLLISDNMRSLLEPDIVLKTGGRQHRYLGSAGPSAVVYFLQGREAEESGVDGCEADLL